jgi:phage terminase large subunit
MPLSKVQANIFNDDTRFRVVAAGRRGGKTFLAMTELAKAARYPNKNVWYVSPSYRQSKQIMWDQLKNKMIAINWADKINESDLSITLRNASKISLRGADNFDSLRGVALDFLAMDEFAYINEKAFTEVLRPTLSDREGKALFITTPAGTNNWAYELYQRGKDVSELNWSSHSFTTLEGGRVTLDEIEQARKDLDIRTFRQEYESSWETVSNQCYYAFDREKNVIPFTAPLPKVIYCGFDFNVGMMSVSIFARNGNVIHAFDEIALMSSNTEEAVEELKNRYPTQRIIAYPDPAGAQRKTSASGKTDITIIRNAGIEVKVPHAHNPVRDGINAVNSKLCNSKGERTFFIDPKCKQTINSLAKYSYKEGTSIPDKDGINDHFSDSIRYYIDYDFPIKRDYDPEQLQPQRFGHAIS